MKKLFFGLTICIGIMNAVEVKISSTKPVRERDYMIKCIDGYKWVQFLEENQTSYNPVGNPIQMFETSLYGPLPVPCRN